ncbi:hypothetical protein L596_001853 [Steinernema carpocapsae]|uniref:Uncharacterized protein n=1 Tax=Steinernema carpocapsae TaxID=34508 RepID=A0A4U8UNH2_STECR|nr:hypothetical protein L596_001853 [Steinernema carpocapsae]
MSENKQESGDHLTSNDHGDTIEDAEAANREVEESEDSKIARLLESLSKSLDNLELKNKQHISKMREFEERRSEREAEQAERDARWAELRRRLRVEGSSTSSDVDNIGLESSRREEELPEDPH